MSCSFKKDLADWCQSVRFWNFGSYTKFPRVEFHNLVGFFKLKKSRTGAYMSGCRIPAAIFQGGSDPVETGKVVNRKFNS